MVICGGPENRQSWAGDVDTSGETYSRVGNVGKIRRDTGGIHNVVEGQLVDERAGLEEEGERLWMVARVNKPLPFHISPRRAKEEPLSHTWPIPPAAPRTAILLISQSSAMTAALSRSRSIDMNVPALTILKAGVTTEEQLKVGMRSV